MGFGFREINKIGNELDIHYSEICFDRILRFFPGHRGFWIIFNEFILYDRHLGITPKTYAWVWRSHTWWNKGISPWKSEMVFICLSFMHSSQTHLFVFTSSRLSWISSTFKTFLDYPQDTPKMNHLVASLWPEQYPFCPLHQNHLSYPQLLKALISVYHVI